MRSTVYLGGALFVVSVHGGAELVVQRLSGRLSVCENKLESINEVNQREIFYFILFIYSIHSFIRGPGFDSRSMR